MADRRFEQFRYGLERKMVDLYVNVAIGSTGAPTINATKSKGIASIARNSAGKYTITLSDSYQYLVLLSHSLVKASGVPATASNVNCMVRSDGSASATPTVAIEFVDNAGVAIELVSGVTVLLHLQLKNSTV